MKNRALILVAILGITACTGTKKEDREKQKSDSLQSVISKRDSMLSYYFSSLNEIETTLDSINTKQKNIFLKTDKVAELQRPVVDNINAEITAINSLMENNHKKIETLNTRLKASGEKNEQLIDAMRKLNGLLTQRENEIKELNAKLSSMSKEIIQLQVMAGFLTIENAVQDEIISSQRDDMHKAYYIVGTSKDLEKEMIIDKKGGLLGIGKSSQLSNDFDTSKFTEIDFSSVVTIPVNNKKMNIITSHPEDSYKIEKENGMIKEINITNPEKFWSNSKYLVIIVKGS